MSIGHTNTVAKVAAIVAGLGLVAMSFASFAPAAKAAMTDAEIMASIAALQAQLSSSSSASATFTKDLTIGSTGADVTALQNWLISKGFSIPAGATGYFGAQTKAALAAYQAANGITPAAGYFGPITRAKVNAAAGGSTGSTGGTSTGGLSGGEADLSNFDLLSGDDLMEGDSDTEIAIAKFDVKGGDVRVQRVTVDFQAVTNSGGKSLKPWDYVDSLAVMVDGKNVGSVDAGSKSDWSDENDDTDHNGASVDFYTIDIPVSVVIDEDEKAELSIVADAQSSIDDTDLSQTFKVQVPDDGIRAVDSLGIQQYTGDGEEITLAFDAAESGDLTVKKSSDTPVSGTIVADDSDTSDEFTVFKFDIKNTDDADALLNSLIVSVATSSANGSSAASIASIIRSATLSVNGDEFDGDINSTVPGTIDFDDLDVTLDGDDTTTFTLTVKLFGQTSHYAATGEGLTFSVVGSTGVDSEGADTGDASTVSGTATGNLQSIAVNGGITVAKNSISGVQTYNSNNVTSSYGTFTVKYNVTAVGDDVYIPKTAATTAAVSGGTFGNSNASSTYAGVVIDTAMSATTTSSAVTLAVTTTADSDNSIYYVVHDGDTETFTVTVTIAPNGSASDINNFVVGLDKVRFSATDTSLSSVQTVEVDQTDSDFHSDPVSIAG